MLKVEFLIFQYIHNTSIIYPNGWSCIFSVWFCNEKN